MSEASVRQLLEIASCGASYSLVNHWSSACGTADFWPIGDLHPPQAQLVMNAVRAQLDSSVHAELGELQLFRKMSASKRISGRTDVHISLFYCGINARPEFAEHLRSLAACHLAALHIPGLTRPLSALAPLAPALLRTDEQPTPIGSLQDFPGAELLGTRIPLALTALVPGRAPIEFQDRFRSAPRIGTTSTTFELRGQVTSTKTHGRFRSVGIRGVCTDASRAEFSHARVEFAENLRKSVGDAFEQPTRRLVMTVKQTTTSRTIAKPLVTCVLQSLHFDKPLRDGTLITKL